MASALGYHPSGRIFIGKYGGSIQIVDHGTLQDADVGGNTSTIVRFQVVGQDTAFAWGNPSDYKVLRTVDGGMTWQPVLTPYRIYPPMAVSAQGNAASMVYLPGAKVPGVRSSDYGATWSLIESSQFPPSLVECLDIAAGPTGELYAGFSGDSSRNMYRSTDGGINWSPLDLIAATIYNIVTTQSGSLLAHTSTNPYNPNEMRGISRSVDEGRSWALVLPLGFDGAGGRILGVRNLVAYSPSAGIIVGTRGSQASSILRSVDDGQSWQSMTTLGMTADTLPIAIAVSQNGEIICATNGQQIYRYVKVADVDGETSRVDHSMQAWVTGGDIIVRLPTGRSGKLELGLYDMNAQRATGTSVIMREGGDGIVRLDVHSLPSAAYVLVARISGVVYVRRVDITR